MKTRSEGFLREELISHESEQFDYIAELHDYLWRFVRTVMPEANGSLNWFLDGAIKMAEQEQPAPLPKLERIDMFEISSTNLSTYGYAINKCMDAIEQLTARLEKAGI